MLKNLIVFTCLTLSISANATPLIYTFNGTVNNINDDGGIVGDSFGVGAAVEYVFIVDTAGTGAITRYNGTINTYTDDDNTDYYYTDFVSGGLISGVNPVFESAGYYAEEFNRGSTAKDSQSETYITGENASQYTEVFGYGNPDGWEIGGIFGGFERAYNASTSIQSNISSTLFLTSINPVPIPAAAWLFGSALLGLGVIKRRKT